MKKNVMMRIASFLLIAVLLTTCAISGTYAKYVTSATGSDTARVAKWGVQVSGIADTLFGTTYVKDSSTGIANTVTSTDDVVAPGTKNDTGVTFSLTGTPEVATNVKFEVTASSGSGAITDVVLPAKNGYTDLTGKAATFDVAAAYYPVVYTLEADGVELVSGNLAAIKAFLEHSDHNKDYDPGTDLAKILGGTTGTYTLTWAWAYGDGSTDQADTYLGNVAAATHTDATVSTTIDFAITVTVTQVD